MMGILFSAKAIILSASALAAIAVYGFAIISHTPAFEVRKSKIIFPHL